MLILGCGTVLAQLSSDKVCYIVCLLIFTIAGIVVGSIRSLQRVGWFANLSVWMNIVSFIIMYVPLTLDLDQDANSEQHGGSEQGCKRN